MHRADRAFEIVKNIEVINRRSCRELAGHSLFYGIECRGDRFPFAILPFAGVASEIQLGFEIRILDSYVIQA